MDRSDIEDFLRRSNSICDPGSPDEPEVRRMSLKEFTGLDAQENDVLRDLAAPTWKTNISQTNLISSFSARRRSVLSQDIPESPSKRLAVPNEETLDVRTALDRLSIIRERFQDGSVVPECSAGTSVSLVEEARRMAAIAKDIASIQPEASDPKWSVVIAETIDCSECLVQTALCAISQSKVYEQQLIRTEVLQVLNTVDELFHCVQSDEHDTFARKCSNLISATNQLQRALH